MCRASKFPQDSPQQTTIDGVENLCKVDEGNKKITTVIQCPCSANEGVESL